MQHLYLMELYCYDALENENRASQDKRLHAEVEEFRLRRDAAISVKLRITGQMAEEDGEPVVE